MAMPFIPRSLEKALAKASKNRNLSVNTTSDEAATRYGNDRSPSTIDEDQFISPNPTESSTPSSDEEYEYVKVIVGWEVPHEDCMPRKRIPGNTNPPKSIRAPSAPNYPCTYPIYRYRRIPKDTSSAEPESMLITPQSPRIKCLAFSNAPSAPSPKKPSSFVPLPVLKKESAYDGPEGGLATINDSEAQLRAKMEAMKKRIAKAEGVRNGHAELRDRFPTEWWEYEVKHDKARLELNALSLEWWRMLALLNHVELENEEHTACEGCA